ncbi:coproporphyrinogen III oxidase [Gallibacterium salpingitidis]|uniref:Heme chaperone HemW n=1 Tax=Gallibacterium salpingitidis TaxID=505341 RepID=A0A1A7NWX8_9PAST|nr:radical SAM family heme chaperone HemW [Gallibacterium salpingitidis]OBW93509.1 coproporphyrinogen III oxidase [Gallibacterium salpingitidis]OBX07516.1 coproporphyrinogen III oxidase [Gallibacterium salpingitidis]OBX10214.1 coproporphyrinogen III oxidase [Gallibacterium salpingitidis]WKS99585.1 radical SAM family heme chaperone HemW [Gallibacterium salpingitidis]
MIVLPPLSLYIHIPWCVQKCPYCDFNSHAQKGAIPEREYLQHLLADLDQQLDYVQGRELHSIFIGGGTPSLFSSESIAYLLQQISQRIAFRDGIEITLEANPGTAEAERFVGYHQAGVTRLSMGIQSFDDQKLQQLGRIHNSAEAKYAVNLAKTAQFSRFNLDLMHGLPNQTIEQALSDLQQAIELSPPHLSWYQLTIEPNTLFASKPPRLPDDDMLWEIFAQGHQLLTQAGYQQYETSAYAKQGYQCEHNLNYWRFGDYLAIGCGAHGKVSFPEGKIVRYSQTKHPKGYLQGNYRYQQHEVGELDRPFEFFMNRFRLLEAVPKEDFLHFTGLSIASIEKPIDEAVKQDYIVERKNSWQITEHGKLFLNDLLTLFLAE